MSDGFFQEFGVQLFLSHRRPLIPAFTSCPHSSLASELGTKAFLLPPEPPVESSAETELFLLEDCGAFSLPVVSGPKFIAKYLRPLDLGPRCPFASPTSSLPGSWPQPHQTACLLQITLVAKIFFFKTLFKWPHLPTKCKKKYHPLVKIKKASPTKNVSHILM